MSAGVQPAVYLRQAGAKAIARSANREALAAFEGTLAALTHLPESRERIERAIDVRLEIRNALVVLGEHEKTLNHLREAEQLAERLGDRQVLAPVLAHMSQYFWVEGDSERAVEFGSRACRAAGELDDPALRVIALCRLGQAYYTSGDYPRAVEALQGASHDSGLELTRFGMARLPSVFSRSWLVRSLAELGRFHEGIERGDEAVRIAETANHAYSVSFACLSLGILYVRKGELPQAVELLERGATICKDMDLPLMTVPLQSTLGRAYALSGRFSDALPLLEKCVAPRTFGQSARHGFPFINLAEGYLLAGRVDEAFEIASRGLDYVRGRRDRGLKACALWLIGEIDSQRDRRTVDTAEHYYREGLELATELGMRPLVAHCHLGLGKLYRRTGEREQAQEHLTTAATMYREMGMRFWLEQTEKEMGELR
jgi:tetratricopeptide (TPR) repeat protein